MPAFRPFSRVAVTPIGKLDVDDPHNPRFIRDLTDLDAKGCRLTCILRDIDGNLHTRIAHVWKSNDKRWHVSSCWHDEQRFCGLVGSERTTYRKAMAWARAWVQAQTYADSMVPAVAALDTYR